MLTNPGNEGEKKFALQHPDRRVDLLAKIKPFAVLRILKPPFLNRHRLPLNIRGPPREPLLQRPECLLNGPRGSGLER